MSRSKKSADSRQLRFRITLHVAIFVIFASGFVSLFRISQIYVDRRLAFPTLPPRVVLADRPAWMSDFLATEIIKSIQPLGLHSAFDRELLVDTSKALASNPWVKRVNQVRRVFQQQPGDTLLIDCRYRVPTALVKWGQYYWLVDSQGVKLPEQYTADQLPQILLGADGKTNVRIIDGVVRAPPESGRVWTGDDIAAGLEMARLLSGLDWADQICDIDVSNFSGRRDSREAQIVLLTRFGTQLRWGRPPSAKDAFVEVPAPQKLAAIDRIYHRSNRVDDNQAWIDVRFDRVTCPGVSETVEARTAVSEQ